MEVQGSGQVKLGRVSAPAVSANPSAGALSRKAPGDEPAVLKLRQGCRPRALGTRKVRPGRRAALLSLGATVTLPRRRLRGRKLPSVIPG